LKSLTGASGNNAFDSFRILDEQIKNIQVGIGISQLMFTPQDPQALRTQNGERTYAGWLGLEFSIQAGSESSANTATLSIGTTGKHSYADVAQEWVHEKTSDSQTFKGWNSQVPSELTVKLHFDHKTRLSFLEELELPAEVDGFYECSGSFGNLSIDAYLGAFLRAGYTI
jgi:hypothetical protein